MVKLVEGLSSDAAASVGACDIASASVGALVASVGYNASASAIAFTNFNASIDSCVAAGANASSNYWSTRSFIIW